MNKYQENYKEVKRSAQTIINIGLCIFAISLIGIVLFQLPIKLNNESLKNACIITMTLSSIVLIIGIAMKKTAYSMTIPQFKVGQTVILKKRNIPIGRVPSFAKDPKMEILEIKDSCYLVRVSDNDEKLISFGPAHESYS